MTEFIRIHDGVFTDFSPLDSTTKVFQKIDLFGATIGVSLTGSKVGGGVGVRGTYGKSDLFIIPNRLTSEPLESSLNVSSLAFIWSVALQI